MPADGREIMAEEGTDTEEKDAPSLSPSTSGEDVYFYSGKNMECRKAERQHADGEDSSGRRKLSCRVDGLVNKQKENACHE